MPRGSGSAQPSSGKCLDRDVSVGLAATHSSSAFCWFWACAVSAVAALATGFPVLPGMGIFPQIRGIHASDRGFSVRIGEICLQLLQFISTYFLCWKIFVGFLVF